MQTTTTMGDSTTAEESEVSGRTHALERPERAIKRFAQIILWSACDDIRVRNDDALRPFSGILGDQALDQGLQRDVEFPASDG